MSKKDFTLSDAATVFNEIMADHSLAPRAHCGDLVFGEKCVLFGMQAGGEKLAKDFFDTIFSKLNSGVYYHYATFEAFQATIASGKLRFFSTKKKSSVGEFIPFCQDHNLDGYWRKGADGKEEGAHAILMDNLFYKSFVASPTENADRLWDDFADHHHGVRLTFQIDVNPEYKDFRKMTYQNLGDVPVIKALMDAFIGHGWLFLPFRFSIMGGFYQLSKHSYQNECRLIAKRIPEYPEAFPFEVFRDSKQDCNYIDCDLTKPTCAPFQIRLKGVVAGRKRPIQDVQDYVNGHSLITGLKVSGVT